VSQPASLAGSMAAGGERRLPLPSGRSTLQKAVAPGQHEICRGSQAELANSTQAAVMPHARALASDLQALQCQDSRKQHRNGPQGYRVRH